MSKRLRMGLAGAAAIGVAMSAGGVAMAAPSGNHGHTGAAARQDARNAYLKTHGGAPTNTHTPDDGDLADQAAQYAAERTAPSGSVSGAALTSAVAQAQKLPVAGGTWAEVTNQPYNAQPSNYTDPFWSNVGAGFGLVGGRTTALATTPDGAWFAGTADGGVWRSTDQGARWTPVFDQMPSLAIGALAVDPVGGSLWAGTGGANVSQDAYAGTGIYRSTDDGATWTRVGDSADGTNPLVSHTVYRIAFDSTGVAYAATDNGLWRYSPASNQWSEVLDPTGPNDTSLYDQQVTDVAVVPGTKNRTVIAAIGWHGPGDTQNNGFYESTDGGNTFSSVSPSGDIDATDIGRTTFAYSADGSKLYAIVQSPKELAAGAETVLQGIFVASGSKGKPASVAGPWTKIGDEQKLASSGSALPVGSGYGVGVQAWYNQDLTVDPANPDHVYAGLEEVFESTDAGQNWVTASPYWNYGLTCTGGCPPTTHPDQHSMMITDGKIVIGNDGGVYSRPLTDAQQYGDWSDLNSTLHSWQYYDARAGAVPGGGQNVGVWGGMQDNGTAYVATNTAQMVEPAGGDGFDVIVDPGNANRMAGEYTDGAVYSSTDGGHTFSYYVSPTCVGQAIVGMTPRADCDPNPRFVTPLTMDQTDPNAWLIGGRYVWLSHSGWSTSCTAQNCDWTPVFDTGSGHAVTALSSTDSGHTVYAAWVNGAGEPGPNFASGIATNYGGTWHQIDMAGLPNRYIAGMTVDPSNPAHAYAVFNGYSRQWITGPDYSAGYGHVFETWDGGAHWTNISANLPDIPGNALVVSGGKLALATDAGVYTAKEDTGPGTGSDTSWSRLGTNLPNASVDDLTLGPDGDVYAATHGRGVWKIAF